MSRRRQPAPGSGACPHGAMASGQASSVSLGRTARRFTWGPVAVGRTVTPARFPPRSEGGTVSPSLLSFSSQCPPCYFNGPPWRCRKKEREKKRKKRARPLNSGGRAIERTDSWGSVTALVCHREEFFFSRLLVHLNGRVIMPSVLACLLACSR